MTPKEKANDLALKFCSNSDIFCPNIASLTNAEKCVDEILEHLLNTETCFKDNIWPIGNYKFWHEVKQELYKCKCS